MGKKTQSDSFWLSYSDLMTSLFFIMLVLFVVCIVVLKSSSDDIPTLKSKVIELENKVVVLQKELEQSKKENEKLKKELEKSTKLIGEYKVKEEEYKKLLNIGNSFQKLSANGSLRYDESHKTFIAKDFEGIEIFEPEKSIIKSNYLSTVDKVGKDLESLLKALNKDNKSGSISYMLIIEGNTANTYDHKFNPDNESAYLLSYRRAMALYKRWLQRGIDLRQYNTEIQICGSGMNGINRDKKVEDNNKRFVIQIIPKISRTE